MSEYLFSYGTLCEAHIQQKLLGRTLPSQSDVLKNYACTWATAYPMVYPEIGSDIDGQCLIIEPHELEQIDHYEGSAYVRVMVQLASGRTAWLYEGNPVMVERLLLVDF
ncbi:MAG: gamma-glutamylcyclotransferase family protein [Aggregatilineales bacterium]